MFYIIKGCAGSYGDETLHVHFMFGRKIIEGRTGLELALHQGLCRVRVKAEREFEDMRLHMPITDLA